LQPLLCVGVCALRLEVLLVLALHLQKVRQQGAGCVIQKHCASWLEDISKAS
jgi:hypothetical protein